MLLKKIIEIPVHFASGVTYVYYNCTTAIILLHFLYDMALMWSLKFLPYLLFFEYHELR